MNKISAQCGHIKRKLSRNEPLSGELLELALSLVEGGPAGTSIEFDNEIARKLKAGEPLGEYEYHILVEVRLLHVRLGRGTPIKHVPG